MVEYKLLTEEFVTFDEVCVLSEPPKLNGSIGFGVREYMGLSQKNWFYWMWKYTELNILYNDRISYKFVFVLLNFEDLGRF